MTEPTNFLNEHLDRHVLEEFLSDYNDSQHKIESLLLSLEASPTDINLLNKLFREVHSIKGNSHFLGFQDMTNFLHALETVLEKLRIGELVFNHSIGDIVLKAIDQISAFVDDAKNSQHTHADQAKHIQNDLLNLVHIANLAKPN